MQVPILGEHSESWFYLEEAKNDKPLVTINPGKMLLFFKFYDPWQKTLSYLGRCYAHDTNTLPALMPFLYKKAGLPDGTALKVSEMLPNFIMPCCLVVISFQLYSPRTLLRQRHMRLHTVVKFNASDTSVHNWIIALVTMSRGLLSCTNLHCCHNGTLHLLISCCTQHT